MNSVLLQAIHRAAARHKTPVWLVGGPVRDGLLNRPFTDWDMVCRGAKKVAQMTAKTLAAKFIVLDEQFQIFRVIVSSPAKVTLDFAELHGKTIEQDLSRRDFTINAMAAPLTLALSHPAGGEGTKLDLPRPLGERVGVRGIIDPFNGRRDLNKRILRAVSERAFTEDPLRLLRAFRFAAQFDCTIESKTFGWIKKHAGRLTKSAHERIREELLRLWMQPKTHPVLRLMDKAHLLSVLFPEIEACRRTAVRYYGKGGVLKHSLDTVENLEWIFERIASGHRSASEAPMRSYLSTLIGGYPRAAWLKWAAFLHDMGKPATAKMLKGRLRFFEHEHVGAGLAVRMAQRMRCSRQESHLLGDWVRHHMRTGNLAAAKHVTPKAYSRFFRDLGEEGVGMVWVSLADHYTYLARSKWGKGTDPVEKVSQRLLKSYFEERATVLPKRLINGHDLIRVLKLKPGPLIGKLLDKVQDAQSEGKVTTREAALAFAKKVMPGRQVLKR